MRIKATIQGLAPLLCNKFTDAAAEKASKRTSKSLHGENGTPRAIAESKLYLCSNDGKTPVIPQINLYKSIMDAGKFFKMGKRQISTNDSSILPGLLDIEGLEFPIEHEQPWSVDSRPVRNPSTKGRMLCHRPRFDDWKLSFEMVLEDEELSEEMLRELIDRAGRSIGLGDFRAACKGPFGRYNVQCWEVAEA